MKDHRFLPVEKHEPVDDYDDYAEESSDELYIGGEADTDKLLQPNGKKTNVLYIASWFFQIIISILKPLKVTMFYGLVV